MKKFTALLTALICSLSIAAFAACDTDDTDEDNSSSVTESQSSESSESSSSDENQSSDTSDTSDSSASDEKTENEEPTDKKSNTKLAASSDVSSVMGDEEEEGNTLYYLAYVLDQQETYSVNAVSASNSMGFISNTITYKDYQDDVMVATDITYGNTSITPKSAAQTCYAYDDDGELVAYRRTASSSVSSSSTPESLSWSDTLYYYYHDEYLAIYGEYSTEMTVYLINEETIDSYTSITDNGDGTYSQTFTLNSKAGWYYQNAMMTNGGLESAVFNSIVLTVTFDGSWQVLEIYTKEETTVKMKSLGLNSDTSATVTTTFDYGEEAIYSGNYEYYTSYYVDAIPTALPGAEDTSSGSVQILDLLESAFSDVLSTDGDQFAFTLNMGENTYYGIIYLQMDAENIAVDTITARLIISADENYDTSDLYIEFAKGAVNVYYSENFAMTVDMNDFSDIISDFSSWVNALPYVSSSSDSSSSSSLDLEALLEGLAMDDSTEGKLILTLDIADLFGFGLYAEINFDVTEEDGETVYTLINITVNNITYGDTELDIELIFAQTDTDIDSVYNEENTPYNLTDNI